MSQGSTNFRTHLWFPILVGVIVCAGLAAGAAWAADGGAAESASPAEPKAVVVAPVGAGTALPAGDPNTPMNQLEAVIIDLTGNSVQYSIDGGATWVAAARGAKLTGNALVRTGFASTCQLSFRGNTILQIEALSCVRIADYIGNSRNETVRANLQYGAVRCGVEKGRIKSDTQIVTPVATLGIRGTVTYVEFDRGTGQCGLAVLQDGPAEALAGGGGYTLSEGMGTDGNLSRHLKNAILGRTVFVTGSGSLGGLTGDEIDSGAQGSGDFGGQGDTGGATGTGDGSTGGQQSDDGCDTCTNGECHPGPPDAELSLAG